jgi:hypothetical protein
MAHTCFTQALQGNTPCSTKQATFLALLTHIEHLVTVMHSTIEGLSIFPRPFRRGKPASFFPALRVTIQYHRETSNQMVLLGHDTATSQDIQVLNFQSKINRKNLHFVLPGMITDNKRALPSSYDIL